MNLFSKLASLLLAAVLLCPSAAFALDLTALYLGGCKRVSGIPLVVDGSDVYMLSTDEKIERIPRYEIMFLATYPAEFLPISQIHNASETKPYRVKTLQDHAIVNLVTGWPVEYSEDKIAFLTTDGSGAVIDRSAIWRIEEEAVTGALRFSGNAQSGKKLQLVHPQAFSHCESKETGRKIISQQILSEPLTIKRELDRIQKGREQVLAYMRKQKFYPVPHIYSNQTSLSLWHSFNSRYGSSDNRSNNFTPFISNELNLGPFSYQHQFVSGSGPNLESTHEEAQTQAAYRFKADYFQLSVMSDLSFLLIGGEKYKWSLEELDPIDFRTSDVARIGFAFDYRKFSLWFFPVNAVNAAGRSETLFDRDSISIPRVALTYRDDRVFGELTIGQGGGDISSMEYFRANAKYYPNNLTTITLSAITRSVAINQGFRQIDLNSKSNTAAVWIEHLYRKRFLLGATGSLERISTESGAAGAPLTNSSKSYFKAGTMVGLTF